MNTHHTMLYLHNLTMLMVSWLLILITDPLEKVCPNYCHLANERNLHF